MPADATILTEQEKRVLRLIAAGHTSEEIADQVSKTVRTVEYYKESIRAKLHAANMPHAIDRAWRAGFLAGS